MSEKNGALSGGLFGALRRFYDPETGEYGGLSGLLGVPSWSDRMANQQAGMARLLREEGPRGLLNMPIDMSSPVADLAFMGATSIANKAPIYGQHKQLDPLTSSAFGGRNVDRDKLNLISNLAAQHGASVDWHGFANRSSDYFTVRPQNAPPITVRFSDHANTSARWGAPDINASFMSPKEIERALLAKLLSGEH